ncbi:MAG: hypothetical protein JWM59_1429 [Verrucomicrobiales bacterium]|nr:hypothetical protein [Verrucomicrobiales bacterium]
MLGEILEAIAADLGTRQTPERRSLESKGLPAAPAPAPETATRTHAVLGCGAGWISTGPLPNTAPCGPVCCVSGAGTRNWTGPASPLSQQPGSLHQLQHDQLREAAFRRAVSRSDSVVWGDWLHGPWRPQSLSPALCQRSSSRPASARADG